MKVNQLFALINTVTVEVLGKGAIVKEDLSNVVSIGKALADADKLDNYVKKLVNHIGKVIFVNRLYAGNVPSVLMDSWEFGSILEKISVDLPDAETNASWDLNDRVSYDPNVFYQPKVSAKFFNSRVTFEIPMSFTEMQVKDSFSNAEQLNGFVSMLTTAIENSMTVKIDALIMRTIANFMGETVVNDLNTAAVGQPIVINPTVSGVRAVNLLKLYNEGVTVALTKANAIKNPDFIRFATYQISLYADRMTKISTLFNIEKRDRFTPESERHVVLLSDFAKASETFLASITFNPDHVALPEHESVPFWQGSGDKYLFADTSKIDVKTSSGNAVTIDGILGVIFDRNALGVTNLDRRVTTNYNPKAEFYTNFYKFDAGYFNDLSENFVMFFVG